MEIWHKYLTDILKEESRMTRRISSIEVKNNSVYVNGRKARDTEGLIEEIKPTELIIPEGEPNAGEPYSGDAYEGTAGWYKFVLLSQVGVDPKGCVWLKWDYESQPRWASEGRSPDLYHAPTTGKEWVGFKTLTGALNDISKWRHEDRDDTFQLAWSKSFDETIKKFEKKCKNISNLKKHYGLGYAGNSKKYEAHREMEGILEVIQDNYYKEFKSYCERNGWYPELEASEDFA